MVVAAEEEARAAVADVGARRLARRAGRTAAVAWAAMAAAARVAAAAMAALAMAAAAVPAAALAVGSGWADPQGVRSVALAARHHLHPHASL